MKNGRINIRYRKSRPVEPRLPASQSYTSSVVGNMPVVGGAIIVKAAGAKGLGIFAARRISADTIVARFDGERLSLREAEALPTAQRSHCVRIPGTGIVMNCKQLRDALVCVDGRYSLPDALRCSLTGLAGLANASKKGCGNSQLVVLRNDDSVPWRRIRGREQVQNLEPALFLRTSRDIERGEEVTFYYTF